MNSWTNDAGEPIMDGAAWRFEQELDAHYDEYERGFDDDFEPDCEGFADDCPYGGCSECDDDTDTFDGMEDAWLDGSYEE